MKGINLSSITGGKGDMDGPGKRCLLVWAGWGEPEFWLPFCGAVSVDVGVGDCHDDFVAEGGEESGVEGLGGGDIVDEEAYMIEHCEARCAETKKPWGKGILMGTQRVWEKLGQRLAGAGECLAEDRRSEIQTTSSFRNPVTNATQTTNNAKPVDIVFVHGLGGSAKETWTQA
jgi:hypothetical protein